MAPVQLTQSARFDKDKRIKSLLAFAADLELQLPAAISSKAPETIVQETQKQISSFPNNLHISAYSKGQEADRIGTSIWNLCTRLRRNFESDKPQEVPIILLLARVFAFVLMDGASDNGRSTNGNLARLFKIGIKTAKSCLERKQFDLTLKVLEHVATYESSLKAECVQDGSHTERLIAEYYILRTCLAWKQDRLDVAEHMYSKATTKMQLFDPDTAESLADVLYEIGKDFLQREQYPLAIKWLERSYEILNAQELDRLSIDASELRTSIMQSLIKSLLGLKLPQATERAQDLVGNLESVVGDKLVVLLLKLEVNSAVTTEEFDTGSYYDILQRMTRSMILTDPTFKLFMFHIRKLAGKSPTLACKALDELLTLRILNSDNVHFVEKVIMTRLWITISHRGSEDVIKDLDELFSMILANITKPVSSAATVAAYTLIWKPIESSYSQGQYDVAERWCHLALHQIFERSGELNTTKISRKLLLCALARKDISSAQGIFGSMPETAKNEPMTRFLMYKIAIRCGETELAAECLQIINTSSAKDSTLLYACCLDAQQVGNKCQVLAVLQLVLEKHGYGAAPAIHLLSLLRLTIGLMVDLIGESCDSDASHDASSVDKLCKIFEGAVSSLRTSVGPVQALGQLWTVAELDWFSKNSYNIAIQNLPKWSPCQSLRLLKCCISFIDQYPEDISGQISEDLHLRKIFCEFSAATALVAMARSEDNIEAQLQDYLNLRKHVESFDRLLQDKLDKMGEDAKQDLLRKLSILVAFDFEAACQLKAWDDLGEIILKTVTCENVHVYEVMADCLLCSQAPTQVLITTMKKIINESWGLETLDFARLAKYMRCLFQIAISDNVEIAEQLLDQVSSHAEEAAETNQPYPAEELEWMATKSFNHAVDLYCSGADEGCRNWAAKALNIAHFCSDEGSLERLLQNKLLSLKFDA